jgi:AcrR family transcriptional regulator
MNVHSLTDCRPMQLVAPPQLPSHADIRSAEILASVRQAFVEKGFDGASMQDLARAAGMSVGNFYRYFPSKAAIIQAMILRDAADIQRDFAAIITSSKPLAALRQVIHHRLSDTSCGKDSDLWAEIEAASRRSPEIAAASAHMESQVVGHFIAVFAAETGLSTVEANRRFSAPAAYVLVLIKAASCLSSAATLDQTEVRTMIGRSIDQTLDEVAASARFTPLSDPSSELTEPKVQACA